MTTVKNCLKNPSCQLWQVLCDGKPCVVESEIQSDSPSMTKNNKMWHLSKFKLREIIDLAVKIEKTGSQLYKKLAKKTSNRQIKSVLLCLATEAGQHQVKLRELGKELTPVIVQEAYPGEHFDYVGSTVETHMFNGADKLERLLENTCSELEIIRLAIDFEKDTLLFLNGFRNLVIKDKLPEIDELIAEEQAHLVKLIKLRKDVTVRLTEHVIKPHRYQKNNRVREAMPLVI